MATGIRGRKKKIEDEVKFLKAGYSDGKGKDD